MTIIHNEPPTDFFGVLAADCRSVEIPETLDVYGWLCGSWDLAVLRYRAIDVSAHGLTGEMHAARVLEGRAVQAVWIMPRRGDRTKTRWTFTEITADSFHWRGEALYPNQTVWIVEGEFLAQRRA